MWFSASFGSVYVKLPRDLYSNNGVVNTEVKLCARETQACPLTAAGHKGTRFKSKLIYCAVTPPGRDVN